MSLRLGLKEKSFSSDLQSPEKVMKLPGIAPSAAALCQSSILVCLVPRQTKLSWIPN